MNGMRVNMYFTMDVQYTGNEVITTAVFVQTQYTYILDYYHKNHQISLSASRHVIVLQYISPSPMEDDIVIE